MSKASVEDFYDTYGGNLDLEKYTRLATRICNRKMSFLNIMDDQNQYMLSEVGVPGSRGTRMDRCDSICHFTAELRKGELLCIPDTFVDDRVKHFPGVAGDPHYRWYLGTPIVTKASGTLGAFCVFDTSDDGIAPDEDTKSAFLDLAQCIITELDLRADCNVALQEKKRFMTSISHEFRDPMHGISMAIDLLSTSRTYMKEDELALQVVRRCTETLKVMVDQILTANHTSTEQEPAQSLSLHSSNLARITEDVLDTAWLGRLHNNGQTPSNLEIVLNMDHRLYEYDFMVNGNDFTRLLLILVNNALKFTRNGVVSVSLGLAACTRSECSLPSSDSHLCLQLCVKDTGCGIPERLQNRIFDDFVQSDAHLSGVGLGLSMARRIIKSHGGLISVSSVVNQGSEFQVTLCVESTIPNGRQLSVAECNADKDLRGMAVSLAADLPYEVRKSLVQHCSTIGCRVIESGPTDLSIERLLEDNTQQTYPRVLITDDPLQPMQAGNDITTSIISVPIGPYKLRGALLAAFGEAFDLVTTAAKAKINDMTDSTFPRDSSEEHSTQARHLPRLESEKKDVGVITSLNPSQDESMSVNTSNRSSKSCLVVDDNKINLSILSTFLKRKGYTCHIASDGVEAVAAVKACSMPRQFDIILMDINMPNMNGVEASRMIREYQAAENLSKSVIVAVSGCSDAEQRSAMARGMSHFFKKPVNLKALTRFLEDIETTTVLQAAVLV